MKMPPGRIPSILDLCLENIATNIIRHGKNFSEVQQGSRIHELYKITQLLFSDRILNTIDHIYHSEEVASVHHFIKFAEFLFEGKVNKNYYIYILLSLKFLYNEYTRCASLRFPASYITKPTTVPHELLSAYSECKSLRSLRLQSCDFIHSQFLELVACHHHHLVEVDLLYSSSCTDETVIEILKNCSNLRIFRASDERASGRRITDRCLFYLCAHSDALDSFSFCQHYGNCCDLGKNLIQLMLHGTSITKFGIACALQHLPLLEKFVDGGLWHQPHIDYHFVAHGIYELHKASMLYCGSPHILKLNTIVFDSFTWHQYFETVKKCCPNLNSFMCCTGAMRALFTEWNEKMMTSKHLLKSPSLPVINLSAVWSFLNCPSVKLFSTDGRYPVFYDGLNCDVSKLDTPLSVPSLEQIHIPAFHPVSFKDAVIRFFCWILSQAVAVRSLTLSCNIAEQSFIEAMKTNTFSKLEEISFFYADLKNVSVKPLIENGTNLKRITYTQCINTVEFVKKHKEIAQQNNFTVDIRESKNTSSCYTTIKLCI